MTGVLAPSSVTVVLRGGLGNQIFQYAAAWGLVGRGRADAIRVLSYGSEWGDEHPDLSSLLGIAIEYPHRGYRTRLPGVAAHESWKDTISAAASTVIARFTGTRLIKQRDPFGARDVGPARHYVLDGFFQHRDWWSESWPWVADVINSRAPKQLEYARSRRKSAMKVRRSDYVGRGIVLTDDFYRRAIRELGMDGLDVVLVCEDEACLPHFKAMLAETGCTASTPEAWTGNPNFDDFWNLAAAPTQILANSSYCWWAAAAAQVAMSDTRVAYPVPWLPNEWSEGPLPDMGLPGWTAVPTEFE